MKTRRWRRRRDSYGVTTYHYVEAGQGVETTLAIAVKTGEHGRDHYPWEWYLTEHGAKLAPKQKRHTDAADSLAWAKLGVEETLR